MTPPRGHIKLARKLFASDPWWNEPREFSRFEAWVYLIQLAQAQPYQMHTQYGLVTLQRGEFVASVRTLAKAWGWSKSRVHAFFKSATKAGRIAGQSAGHAGGVYLIVNYDAYQRGAAPDETEDRTDSGTETGQTRDRRGTRTSSKAVTTPRETRGGWPAEAASDWQAARGGPIHPGRVGKALGPLVEAEGWAAVRPGWQVFVASPRARFGPQHFVEHFDDFRPYDGPMIGSGGMPIMTREELWAMEAARG